MRIAIISPIAWRTPPRHYGPWERVVSLLAEGLEIIQDGINGFIVSNVEEMAGKIKDVMDISREACRKTVESRFTQEKMVKEYIDVYKEILKIS